LLLFGHKGVQHRAADDLGWPPRRLNPLIYGAKFSVVTLTETLQVRPPKGEVGRCPALRLIPGKGELAKFPLRPTLP
jgi:hypothetical protein